MKHARNTYHYQIRKCKKNENIIRKNSLLNACINGNGDLFNEIKKSRRSTLQVASSIDGISHNVEDYFKSTYEALYNCTEDKIELRELWVEIDNKINYTDARDVLKVTPALLKEASGRLKNGKSDPVYLFSSDCIKNAPDILFDHLSIILRSFLFHGHVSTFLLIATLVPIIKNKLGSISSSKNYRSIALSSLLLKILDWVTLLLFGTSLGLDDLQYAYQSNASTTMSTWLVLETVSYFLRNGSEVFTCQTDMSKAFDMVRHSLLFRKLLLKGFSRIFLRIFIFIYSFQFANVRWNGVYSDFFSLCNGVRQGAILSGILYCFYVNEIFELLRRKNLGCWINNNFCGMSGYSDDNWVIAPSINSLQDMLKVIEDFCIPHNLKFSTDSDPNKCKTKCIAFLQRQRHLPDVFLCGDRLPWVDNGVHLGNHFSNTNDRIKDDVVTKRGSYIQKNCELNQEFSFAHPRTKILLNNIYNCHFTGSPLWDLFSKEVGSFEKTWNVSVRKMLDLPLATHRYLIEPVSETFHLRRILMNRFISFLHQIERSGKVATKQLLGVIYRNTQSVTGSNIRHILRLTGRRHWREVRKVDVENIDYFRIPEQEKWRVGLIHEMLEIRSSEVQLEGFTVEETNEILEFACTS